MSEPFWVPLGAAPAPPASSGIEKLFDTLLSSPAADITIPNIPQTYSHLRMIGMLRGDLAAAYTDLRMQFNGDTGANYDSYQMYSFAAGAAAVSELLAQTQMGWVSTINAGTATAGFFTPVVFDIPDYRSVLASKMVQGRASMWYSTGSQTLYLRVLEGRWRTFSSPLTSIRFFLAGGNFVAGSRLTLYGTV
jgi:hypothetical protein